MITVGYASVIAMVLVFVMECCKVKKELPSNYHFILDNPAKNYQTPMPSVDIL